MLLSRSVGFVYILTFFTLFNSKWTKMSIADILVSKHSTSVDYNTISESYKSVKAVQVTSKNFSKLFSLDDSGDGQCERIGNYAKVFKTVTAVSSKAIYCFFTSYLHLLQLF